MKRETEIRERHERFNLFAARIERFFAIAVTLAASHHAVRYNHEILDCYSSHWKLLPCMMPEKRYLQKT